MTEIAYFGTKKGQKGSIIQKIKDLLLYLHLKALKS